MSQYEVALGIKELGGHCTRADLVKHLNKKFPGELVNSYTSTGLSRLQAGKAVQFDYITKEWVLIDEDIIYNRNVVVLE